MNITFRIFLLSSALFLGLTACSPEGAVDSSSSTYSISGTMDPSASASSSSYGGYSSKVSKSQLYNYSVVSNLSNSRTVCSDGYYYSLYCVSFSTPPVAAEGNVDCSGGGSFTVSGLPKGNAVGCFVRRYSDSSSSSSAATTVGAVQIPAANIGGSTDTLVSNGDVGLNVALSSSGSISANVTSGTVNDNLSTDTSSTAFTASNMNGVWNLTCNSNNGGTAFSAGRCKCFLGESFYSEGSYSNQEQCMDDPNGPGAGITSTVQMGIGIYIHKATALSNIPIENNQTIPSGSTINAISIWGTSGSPGSYISLKGSGGEGVTTLGGALSWDTSTEDPTTSVAWSESTSVTIKDGNSNNITFTLPAKIDFNTAHHEAMVNYLRSLGALADAQGFTCTWGPNDSDAYNTGTGALEDNIECLNQVLSAISSNESIILPRVRLKPFCDQNGCQISKVAADSSNPYYNTSAFNKLRIETEDGGLDYPTTWSSSDDYSSSGTNIGPKSNSIGISPKARYVFQPLDILPNGAGFRDGHHDERHFECKASGGDVNNAACSASNTYYYLKCQAREELAIKFIGSSEPFDVIFDQTQSIAYAELRKHDSNGESSVTPTGTDTLTMCATKLNNYGGSFMATATKQ
ncbi:MAG: hypothetical protein KDD50_04510 [Bdellovibrionales bacterium]|nr:hypothetical protein [Bdellovibrionales bacterium]